jgi:branched-chain amino acid transport system substrate-binding protein
LAATPTYTKNNLVVVSPSSTSVEISGASEYLFRTVPSDFFTGNALAEYMLKQLKLTKAAIFYVSTSNYSNSLRNVVTTSLYNGGGEVVVESDLTLTDFNPSDAIKQAQDRGAEVLIFVSNSASLDKAIQVIQVNEQRLKMLAGDSLYNPRTLELGRKDAVGMVLAIPWHIYSNRDSKFAQNATQLWKGDVNWRTAMSYDAAEVLIAGIKINPTRTGLQQALANPSFVIPGAGKDIRFLPSGDRNQAVQLVTIESAPDLDFHYRFMPLK